MSRVSAQVLSVSISDNASFLTRLRQSSSSSSARSAHGACSRSNSKPRRTLEVGFGLEHLERIRHALAIALLEAIEDRERGLELAGRDRVVEFVAVLLELRDVAGQEVAAHAVERFEIAIEHQGRHRIVDRRLPVMGALEHRADEARDLGLTFGRAKIGRGRRVRRGRRRLGRAEQQRADREHHRGQHGGAGSLPAAGGWRDGVGLGRWFV